MGLGHWYSAYALARTLVEDPRAALRAVAWPQAQQLQEFATTFGVEAYSEYEALLQRPDIDIVLIVPPVADIPACTIKAAQAGKHIILGKPMAMTVAQATAMVNAVEASGVVCVPYQGTHRLRARALKQRLEAGTIGDIVVMHGTARWSIAEDWWCSGRPGWFADPRQVPGGAFIDEGIYVVELLCWLAGSAVVQVEAKMANLVHTDLQVEDWGMATFTFANGILATFEASWTINAPQKTGPSPKQNSVRRLEIIGTRGEIIEETLRLPERAVLAAGASGWVFERDQGVPYGPAAFLPLTHLIECLENQRQPAVTIQEAHTALRVALAAYAAARRGTPVSLSS
jgi:predicted dehydrogenase